MDVLLKNEIIAINNSITICKENKMLSTSLSRFLFDCFDMYYAFSLAIAGQINR